MSDGSRNSIELRSAPGSRLFIETVDVLLYLNSMQQACPKLFLSGLPVKERALASAAGFPAHGFSDPATHRQTAACQCSFSDPYGHENALLIECGQPWKAEVMVGHFIDGPIAPVCSIHIVQNELRIQGSQFGL